MTGWNVHVYCFDDLGMLRGCVDSVPPDVDVHVFDGRHMDFAGEHALTPEIEYYCRSIPQCEYHAPPAEDLPFGDADTLDRRSAGYYKSRFVFEHLPDDEWTLKMDTDERLEAFDADLSAFDADRKLCPEIVRGPEGEDRCHIARLFQPGYWTPWIGDCLLPREAFPMDVPLENLATIWEHQRYRVLRFVNRTEVAGVRIRNVGHDRPADYQARRVEQLEARGRAERAAELRE